MFFLPPLYLRLLPDLDNLLLNNLCNIWNEYEKKLNVFSHKIIESMILMSYMTNM